MSWEHLQNCQNVSWEKEYFLWCILMYPTSQSEQVLLIYVKIGVKSIRKSMKFGRKQVPSECLKRLRMCEHFTGQNAPIPQAWFEHPTLGMEGGRAIHCAMTDHYVRVRHMAYCRFNMHCIIFEHPRQVSNLLSEKPHVTRTWFEHATFWTGVRRATVAPPSLLHSEKIVRIIYLNF